MKTEHEKTVDELINVLSWEIKNWLKEFSDKKKALDDIKFGLTKEIKKLRVE